MDDQGNDWDQQKQGPDPPGMQESIQIVQKKQYAQQDKNNASGQPHCPSSRILGFSHDASSVSIITQLSGLKFMMHGKKAMHAILAQVVFHLPLQDISYTMPK
jgi:hypothetical protein